LFAITCDRTGTTGYAGCGCPDGHDPADLGHHDTCQMGDLQSVPGCAGTCCGQDHDHDPQSCDAKHGACPDPAGCKLWKNVLSHQDPSNPDAPKLPKECPGGHHGYGVPGCVVCHPLTITFLPTEPVQLRRAAG
jgi:hypothetical protein